MNQRRSRSQPRWTDVKAKLTGFDRLALLGLIQDLYSAHKDNQTFLHARFGLGEDPLRPYKETMDHWLWPDAFSRQAPSPLKAKQAISNYKKAVGDPAGLAELMLFYCEQASGFASNLGYQDECYFNALVSMFQQTVMITATLPAGGRDALVARLDRVRTAGHMCGYGVGDDMDHPGQICQAPRHARVIPDSGPDTAFTQPCRNLTKDSWLGLAPQIDETVR